MPQASGASNVSDLRLMSHVGRVCA